MWTIKKDWRVTLEAWEVVMEHSAPLIRPPKTEGEIYKTRCVLQELKEWVGIHRSDLSHWGWLYVTGRRHVNAYQKGGWLPDGLTVEEVLHHAMQRKGLTQTKLAAEMNMRQPTLSRLMRGQRKMSAEDVIQLARVLDLDPRWVLYGTINRDSW